jgi:hypothetical protein
MRQAFAATGYRRLLPVITIRSSVSSVSEKVKRQNGPGQARLERNYGMHGIRRAARSRILEPGVRIELVFARARPPLSL